MNKIRMIVACAVAVIALALFTWYYAQYTGFTIREKEDINLGFIGAMTGSVAKYGAYEAVSLAVDEINAQGGINGRKINMIYEDGKCDAKEAVIAANKLISIDGVRVILGGHCTPESASIAPIAEKNKVIMLASITSSPVLTNMGDYVFRTSPISTVQSEIVANASYHKLGLRKMAIIYEQTDYARPIAEKMKESFSENGGSVVVYDAYNPGTLDFRTLLAKAKEKGADSIFFSAQSPDSVLAFMKQYQESGTKMQLLGNEVTSGQILIDKLPQAYEGYVFAAPAFNPESRKTKSFVARYNKKHGTENIPYGIWTAESYDAVWIVRYCIEIYGEDPEEIKECLYNIQDFDGVSGKISIDENGDGIRSYSLKIVRAGKVYDY